MTVKQAKGSALAPKLLALLGPDGAPVDLAGAKKHVFNGKADVYQDVPLALLGEYLVRCGTQSGLYGDTGVVSISLKFPVFKKAKLPDSDLVVHPYVDDVTPSSGFDNRSYAAVVVEGDFFAPGPAVRLEGPATRDAAAVSRLSDDLLSVDLDLVGLPAGTYDLVVSYANGAVGREVGGFTVLPTPLPAGITPSGAFDNRPQPFVVTGSRFQGGLAAAVVPAGGGSPVAGTGL